MPWSLHAMRNESRCPPCSENTSVTPAACNVFASSPPPVKLVTVLSQGDSIKPYCIRVDRPRSILCQNGISEHRHAAQALRNDPRVPSSGLVYSWQRRLRGGVLVR